MKKMRPLPLEGIRVVEITTAWAGPVCGIMLSDMGAEVIKIENPTLPDNARRNEPFAEGKPGLNRSGYFAFFNRGKKSCLLDLKTPEGVEIIKRLIKISDIVIENFAPRVMDSLGLGYSVLKELKPDIIMISASGYGATGPDKDCVAFGPNLEAYVGLNLLIGYPGGTPQKCGTVISDHVGAMSAAFATLAALHYRDITGEGQHIDISEAETLLCCMPEAIMEFTMNGRVPQPQGNRDDNMALHGCYRCLGEDKWVAITVSDNKEWQNLCRAMGQPNLITDERFQDGFRRRKNQDELDAIISEWTSGQTATDVTNKLQKLKVAAAPVYSGEELYSNPHLRARGFFVEIVHPEVGKRELPGLFARLSETPGEIRGPDPMLGEHTDQVFNELLANNPG